MMTKISCSGYRFPPEIVQLAIWPDIRITLSFRDAEDLLAERGLLVPYETARRRVSHFGRMIAVDLHRRRPKLYTIWKILESQNATHRWRIFVAPILAALAVVNK